MMRRCKRIDNKGMSLVELLIAVTILAIIVVPLLHAFVSSARVNRKSKQTQRLTTMGQDIMEGIKAYSVEDLAYEFDYPTVSSCSAHPSGFQLISPVMLDASNSRIMELTMASGVYSQVNTTTTPKQSILESGTAPNIEYKFDDTKFDNHTPYYFAVTNISSERSTAGSYKADILITVDPRKYISDAEATTLGVTGSNVTNASAQHNSNPMADLYSMDTTRDAFFLEAGSQINTAYNQLRALGSTITSAQQISKDIDVKVENDVTGKKVTYTFKYRSPEGYEVIYPTNPSLSTLKYATLENVYLFYMPSYNTAGDKITYTNSTNTDIVFSLVKRQILLEDGINPAYSMDDLYTLRAAESTYNCDVFINDSDNKTTFKTNVDTDLSKLIDPAGGGDVLAASLTGVNISYSLGGATGNRLSVAGNKKEDRIFDVTIDIYEPGTIEAALSAGSALPADKHLVTVRGNMN